MNKRQSERRAVWVPVELRDGLGGRMLAVSDDVSEGGVRLVSPAKAEVGVTVELALHLPHGARHTVTGRVVRIEANADDPDGHFPHRIAVAFTERIEGLDGVLTEVEDLEANLD